MIDRRRHSPRDKIRHCDVLSYEPEASRRKLSTVVDSCRFDGARRHVGLMAFDQWHVALCCGAPETGKGR